MRPRRTRCDGVHTDRTASRSLWHNPKGHSMKVVVIGGSGLIGSKVVSRLREHGHEAVAASPATGVNTITGEGLAKALEGAAVVIDVSNSPSFEEAAALNFFETSTRNLLAAEAAAGVGHHVALSVVGTDRLSASGYFRAKAAQEKLITTSSIPYSIVHATQFFEFVESIAQDAISGDTVRVAPVLIQPMAADDVASAVGRVSVGAPVAADVVEVDARTWVIHGVIPVGGDVIMAEFETQDQAKKALRTLSAPEHGPSAP